MLHDIETRAVIDRLLVEFYKVVIHDPEIGHHFDKLDLEHHLPIIGNFCEKVLFGNPVYFNNPMAVHQKVHERFPLEPQHFLTVGPNLLKGGRCSITGEMADLAMARARATADSLDQNLNGGTQISR